MGEYNYQISIDKEHQLIRLVLKGVVSKIEGEQVIIETRAASAENGLDILCDIREAEIVARPADWFFLLRNKDIYPSKPNEKTALLITSKKRGFFGFVGNVALNMSMNIQVFVDESEALDWLQKES